MIEINIYLMATAVSVFFAFCYYIIKNKETISSGNLYASVLCKYFAILSFLPLFLVSALRYDVGTDYFMRYVPGFLRMESGRSETYEFGFLLLNKVILFFTNEYQWLFVITSLIFCYFIYKTIYEQSKDICLSIILLVITTHFFMSLNVVRQCMSAAIFLYAVKYIKEKNLLKYSLFIVVAVLIHNSAFIYFFIYFIVNRKVSIRIHFSIIISCILALPMVQLFIKYFIMHTKYYYYIGGKYDNNAFSFRTLIINSVILVLCYIVKSKSKNKEIEYYDIFTNIQLITVLMLMYSSSFPNFDRILLSFTFIQVIHLPTVINMFKNKYIRYSSKFALIIFYSIYMFNKIVVQNCNEVLPYQTIFMR